MGHPRNTWEAVNLSDPSEMIYWPKELLPITVPESRVFAFGYPTGFATFYPIVTDPIAHTTIDNNAASLVVKLGTIRRETHTVSSPKFDLCVMSILHASPLLSLQLADSMLLHSNVPGKPSNFLYRTLTRGLSLRQRPFQPPWLRYSESEGSQSHPRRDLPRDAFPRVF